MVRNSGPPLCGLAVRITRPDALDARNQQIDRPDDLAALAGDRIDEGSEFAHRHQKLRAIE